MNKEKILKEVLKDIQDKFDIKCVDLKELHGGWKNLKWILNEANPLVIKVFSKDRYDNRNMHFIGDALKYQDSLYKNKSKVVKVYSYKNNIIQKLPSIDYMLMDYFEGVEKSRFDISLKELDLLGSTCADIHNSLKHLKSTEIHTDHLKNLDDYIIKLEKDNWQHEIKEEVLNIYRNLDKSYYEEMKVGLTHSDFSNDNMLFSKDDIRILDFDRCRVSYQNQDIGRAVMSYCFNGKYLEKDKVDSFINGYSKISNIDYTDIVKAIKLTWIVEVTWWMSSSIFIRQLNEKIERFKDELIWITKKWNELDKQIYR